MSDGRLFQSERPIHARTYAPLACVAVALGVVGGAVKFNGAQVTDVPRVSLIQFGLAFTER